MEKSEINNRLKKLLESSDNEYQKLVSSYEKEVLKLYKNILSDIKLKIYSIYEKYGDDVNYADISTARLKNLDSQIKDQIKELTNKNISVLKDKLQYFMSESYSLTSFAIEKAVEVNLAFGLIDPLVVEAAWKNPLNKISWPKSMQDHANKYLKDIRTEITRGLIEGKGYGKITKAITEKTGVNAYKVLRIVRTEGHRVQNTARIISFQNTEDAAGRLGIKINRVWVATLDSRTRDSHQTMDGQIADENNLFHYPGGETTEAPGISGPAEEVINCRCTVITEFAEFPQSFRRDRAGVWMGEEGKFPSYKDWKEGKIKRFEFDKSKWNNDSEIIR